MESLVYALLSNAVVATAIAPLPLALGRAGRAPALVHALWLVVLLKLVTPPLWSIAVAVPAFPGRAAGAPAVSDEPASAWPEDEPLPVSQAVLPPEMPRADDREPEVPDHLGPVAPRWVRPVQAAWPAWEAVALLLMLGGGPVVWTLAGVRIVRAGRLLGRLQPAPEDLQEQVRLLARRFRLSRPPMAYLAPGRIPPMLWVLGRRTRLLLPSGLWNTLDHDQQTALLAHELAHLKRGDPLVRWFDLAVAGLYWWHPVVWLARRGLREAEELCCDAWAVWAVPGSSRSYAAALLAALDFVSGRPAPAAAPALAVVNGKKHVQFLTRRMRMIVHTTTPRALGWAARLGLLGLAALVLPVAPTWAQPPGSPAPGAERHERLAHGPAGPDVRPEADDDEDEKDDERKDRADRLERLLKDLGERLGKDLEPVAQEVTKALEKAAREASEAIDKEGVISKDLREAIERARNELHEAFRSGGPLDQQARESAERARQNMREAVERARQELREAVRQRADRAREEMQRAREEVERRAKEEAERRGLFPGHEELPGEVGPADLERARREVREMEQQLRRAMRRLEALERRQQRGPRREGGPPERAPERPAPPRPPVPPSPPGAHEEHPAPPEAPEPPARPEPPRGPRGPGMRGPGMAGPGGAPMMNPRVERRLRDLEEKMDRLLKELDSLKGDKDKKDKTPSTKRGVES